MKAKCRVAIAALASLGILTAAAPLRADERTPPSAAAPGERSPATAFALSALGTLVSGSLFISTLKRNEPSMLVPAAVVYAAGASLGYLYGGLYGRAVLGIAIRGAALAGVVALVNKKTGSPGEVLGDVFAVLGLVGLTGTLSTIDTVLVPGAVRRDNERKRRLRMTISPAIVPAGKGVGVGIGIGLQF